MEEILKRLCELVRICESRVKKLEHESSELSALRGNLNKQKDDQDAKEKDIKAQEDSLSKKKQVVKTIEEAQGMIKQAGEEKKRLKAEWDSLEDKKSQHEKKVKDDMADIARQKEKISAMSKETEEKAKNYRVEVMNEILKNSAANSKK